MAGTSDTKSAPQKGDIPAAQDVIDGAAHKTMKQKAKTMQQPEDAKTIEANGDGTPRSVLVYIAFSLSVLAIIGVFLPYLGNIMGQDAEEPEWQVTRDADKAEFQTAFTEMGTKLAELEARLLDFGEEMRQSQLARDANQDANLAAVVDDLQILAAEIGSITTDIDKKFSERAAQQPPAPQASLIWFEGLATASQLGQDLGYWKSRLSNITPPAEGWSPIQTDIIKALSTSETASHQRLISDAYALVEATHLTKPAIDTHLPNSIESEAGWLSWINQVLRFEKIEARPDDEINPKMAEFQKLVSKGALVPISKALLAMENLNLSDVQDWQAKFESRTSLDALIASAFHNSGGL